MSISREADLTSVDETSVVGHKRRLLFMGQKRSGKSSIINVVLYKLPPNETVFIPTTVTIKKHMLYSFKNYQIWDLPGQIDYLEPNFDTESIFGGAGAMVWVLDAQDDYAEPVTRLTETVFSLQQLYPDIKYTVFIHKIDSLSNDFLEDIVSDIMQRIMDELNDLGLENPPISFYRTSVYDDSIYEGLSKVLQLMNSQQLPSLEALLNTIGASCKMEKVYLFDVYSKLYFASDTSPVHMEAYGVCSDYIDTIVDLSEIYGWDREKKQITDGNQTPEPESSESIINGIHGCCLYLKEMNKYLALIGLSKEPRFSDEKALVDYNVSVFQESLAAVLSRKPEV